MRGHIRWIATVALAASSAGCGNSSSDTATTSDSQGQWQGSYTIAAADGVTLVAPTSMIGVVQDGGFAFFYDAQGFVYTFPLPASGSTVTGTLVAYSPLGYTLSSGGSEEPFSVTVSVSNDSISGTFSGNFETGSFNLSRYSPFVGTPAILPGAWQGFYLGSGEAAVDVSMNTDGSFSGNDGNGCSLVGNVALISGAGDLFSVTVASAGTSTNPAVACHGVFTGIGFESTADLGAFGGATGTYFYTGVFRGGAGFVAEFKLP